ncbi:MAG: hypothetical protein AAF194_06435, partial [Pseudomonadota bacterium]
MPEVAPGLSQRGLQRIEAVGDRGNRRMPVNTIGVSAPRFFCALFKPLKQFLGQLLDRLLAQPRCWARRTRRAINTVALRWTARALVPSLAAFVCLYGASAHAQIEIDDEDIDRAAIVSLSVVHRAAFGASFSPDPITALVAEGVAVASEVALKFIRSPLTAPNDVSFRPRTALFDPETGANEAECIHEFELPQAAFLSSDLFGFNLGTLLAGESALFPVPQDWGDLGAPRNFHYNTEVMVSASNPFIERSLNSQTVRFPAGNHQILWRADTVFDPIFDAALPAAILAATAYTKWRRGEFLLANPAGVDDLVKAYQKGQKAGKTLLQKAKLSVQFALDACESRPEVCLKRAYTFVGKPAADFVTDFEILTVNRERTQLFTVFDVHDPTLDILERNLTIDALDFGGTFVDRVENQILASVEADDTCGRQVTLTNDLPTLLPLGNTDVTWTATDPGPG